MNVIDFLLSQLLLMIYLFYFIKEYYNISRLFKGLKNVILTNKINLIFYIAFYMFSFLFFVLDNKIILLFSYIFLFLNIIMLPIIRFPLHKRGIRLLLVSLIINCMFSLVRFDVLHLFIYVIPFLSLTIANLFLFPFEELNRRKYIKMAKKKIEKYNPLIIGITGSFGKTTFKNYLYHILKNKYSVIKSDGNINTLMGLTKWINSSLTPLNEVLIVEIGIDKNKGIRKFKKLFSLDIGVITSVGKMHLSTFKTFKNIVNSKCEIDLLIKDKGVLFFNGSCNEIKNKEFKHKSLEFNNKSIIEGYNKYQNIAINGVIEIAKYLNIDDLLINKSLLDIPKVERRFEIKKNKEMIVINDSYNSNYEGIKEAIKYMERYPYKKIVITGGLIELGKFYNIENYKTGLLMKDIDYLFLISNNKKHPLITGFKKVTSGKFKIYKTIEHAKKDIESIKGKKIVLLGAKGSDYFIK